MQCTEIAFADLCADLAQLYGMWQEITDGGTYDVGRIGYRPLQPFVTHRATIVHITQPDDLHDWIIQAFTSDFDALANQSFVGKRFGDIPDAGYRDLIGPSLLATRQLGKPMAHFVDGSLAGHPTVYQKLTLPLHNRGEVEKLVTLSRES